MVVRVRQSVLGGAAHLLNFEGSDTMSAAYHVQYHLNKGVPVTQITPLLSRPHSLPQPTRYPDQGGPRGQGGPSSCHVDGTWGFSLRKGLVIQGRAGGGIADPDSCGVCVCVCVRAGGVVDPGDGAFRNDVLAHGGGGVCVTKTE